MVHIYMHCPDIIVVVRVVVPGASEAQVVIDKSLCHGSVRKHRGLWDGPMGNVALFVW